MPKSIILEGDAALHDREHQLSVTVDGTALTWVFEQDLGLRAEYRIGGNVVTTAKTRRVRVTIEDLEPEVTT